MSKGRLIKVPDKRRRQVLDRDHYLCQYCGDPAFEVDHIVPYTWSIHNDERNLVASCKRCNLVAGNKVFDSFEQKQKYIIERRNKKGEDAKYLGHTEPTYESQEIAYYACESITTPNQVINFLGMSYRKIGIEFGRIKKYAPLPEGLVFDSLSKNPPNLALLQVLGQLLSNRLTRLCGETIGVAILQNSPMRVIAYRYCNDCGAMYAIDRPDVKRCTKCRKG